MAKIDYYKHLSRAFMMLAFMGAVSACVNDDFNEENCKLAIKEGLAVAPTISESQVETVTTRAASIVDLKEKYLNTLDVFVEHVTGTTGDGTFIKQYHLPFEVGEDGDAGAAVREAANNWLSDNWRDEGLLEGEKYNIYVAANNPLTKVDIANVTALKALTFNEVTQNIAKLDDDGNIGWASTASDAPTSGNIFKLYDENATNSDRALTKEKEFMMDGVIPNWTPTIGSKEQVFPVEMNRAAAKIVMNLKFDADFLKSLTHTKKTVDGTVIWEEKPAAEKVTITGTPAWRFHNFAFGAPVFTPDEAGDGIEVHNAGFQIREKDGYEGDDMHHSIITYSYPNKWTDVSAAPSLIVSIGYTQNGSTSYNYYRIPIVSKETKTLNRNTIYVVNATIATRGSELHEDVTELGNLTYEVLPWNDKNNSDVMENTVSSVQHYYLNVSPKIYTLRGDGEQSLIINFSKATGTKVNWKLFTYDDQGNQTGIVANNDPDATRAWFYNSTGAFITTYSDTGSGINWSNTMGVDITIDRQGEDYSTGTVTVKSQALTNKAIKYIRLRVYLDEVVDNQSLENTYHEDIIIRHFPTDNIQNIAGSWSSYHDANNSTENITMTTRSLSVAQSWVEEYGVDYTTSQVTTTDNITYSVYSAHVGEEGYAIANAQATTNRSTFRSQVQDNEKRRAANGQANGVLGEDGYCYWGVNPSRYYGGGDDDYYTGNGYNVQHYRYDNLYRARYTHTYTYTQYSITVRGASTGNWVDWDATDKANHSDQRQYTIQYYNDRNLNTFIAKTMDNGSMYDIQENSHGNNYNRYYSTDLGDAETGLTNNHMYVIQISSTSSTYVLGRPYVNESTHQSKDDVVSPAFMIASQLGAVTPFLTSENGPANAATHCSRYMEVAEDGTRYTGWRLPTEAEIKVITGYQYGVIDEVEIPSAYQVLVPVLTGQWYHSLSGQEVEANPNAGSGSTTKSYLRCVRDLSAKEVDRLNGFDKIIEKYQ